MTPAVLPSIDDVRAAADRVAGIVEPLDATPSPALSHLTGATVLVACEYRQPSGSFKIRGATNAVLAAAERGASQVTTASTGNHARAVAEVGRRHGLGVRAFLAAGVAQARVQALESAGAVVDRSAPDQTEAILRAREAADGTTTAFVPPFDHADVVAGQGTLGLELARLGLDAVLVPVSGGGLAAGIGLALRADAPDTRLLGVGAERAPAMARSLEAGHPVTVEEIDTVATSLMGDLGPDNAVTFPLCREVIDEMTLVGEEGLIAATEALHALGHPVEPAAAAGVALLQATPERFYGQRIAVLLTGREDAP